MSGKTILAVAAMVMLGCGNLTARKGGDASGDEPTRNQRLASAEQEKRILDVLEQMLVGPHSDILSVPPEDGRVLRLLAEATGAKRIVEIGTSNGYAAIWLCLALRTTGGRLTTFEIDHERAALARANFKQAGVEKLVTLMEGDAHKEVTKLKEPIDVVFIDADKDGYLDYLKKLLPLVRPGGLILAHDTIDLAPRMRDYLDAVTTDPALETLFLHEQGPGICVTLKKRRTNNRTYVNN